MNEHDKETRQFLALVNSGHAWMAMSLAAIRTPFAMKALGIIGTGIGLTLVWLTGAPQSIAMALITRFS